MTLGCQRASALPQTTRKDERPTVIKACVNRRELYEEALICTVM